MANQFHFPAGVWLGLLTQAFSLLDAVAADGIEVPHWSLGGGTVLMFHYEHRLSKDIDIFVPDPQFLGYINPRIGGKGEDITQHYTDGAEYIKLYLPEGEIDFVAALPLTAQPFARDEVQGREVLLETPVEIVAKKLWHRGDRATPRDLLDLAVVIEHEYDAILQNKAIFTKNLEAFIHQCEKRKSILEPVYEAIEKLEFDLTYDASLARVKKLQQDIK
jgi:hypothetical protein